MSSILFAFFLDGVNKKDEEVKENKKFCSVVPAPGAEDVAAWTEVDVLPE